MSRCIYQIASGDSGRNYSSLFLDHDVMLMGSGDPGHYGEKPQAYDKDPRRHQLRSFCEDPSPGDVISYPGAVGAVFVGVVPSSPHDRYNWSECFSDVLGWDLQHMRRVVWDRKPVEILEEIRKPPFFGQYKQQKTFTMVHEEAVTRMADRLAEAVPSRELKPLPTVPTPLSDEELGLRLFAAGLSNDSIERVLQVIVRIRRLTSWYWMMVEGCSAREESQNRPTEHEIVAHVVAPLLMALGWSEQLVAIEWNKIDVAFFVGTPTTREKCCMVLEAKRLWQPLAGAYEQAKSYVRDQHLVNCKTIATTEGSRLFLYRKQGETWPDQPSGYANFHAMRKDHVFHKGTSAVDTLIGLMPSRIGQSS